MSAPADRVELIFDADCPNAAAARSLLIKGFTLTGVSARWREWERSAPDSPEYVRCFGSPTILVNGKDVTGTVPDAVSRACRVYFDERGKLSRTPALATICSALLSLSPDKPARTRWQAIAASFPAVGAAFLPKLTCPLCFPAYTAVLGALGLEFFDYTPYLLPLTAIFLVAAIAVLAAQARRTANAYPLLLGFAASVLVLAGKFRFESDWITLGGIVLLIAAVFVAGRIKPVSTAFCPVCAAGEGGQQPQAR